MLYKHVKNKEKRYKLPCKNKEKRYNNIYNVYFMERRKCYKEKYIRNC